MTIAITGRSGMNCRFGFEMARSIVILWNSGSCAVNCWRACLARWTSMGLSLYTIGVDATHP